MAQVPILLHPDSSYTLLAVKAAVQSWSVASFRESRQLSPGQALERIDNRLNVYLRRARLGFSGEPYGGLRYQLSLAYDNLGKDDFSAAVGRENMATFGVLDAFLTWRISRKDWLHLSAGYFRPQIGRESITSAFQVNSYEKSISQTYLRQHLVGQSNGRSNGISIGGQWRNTPNFTINYTLGFFNTPRHSGAKWAALYTGRLLLMFGEPESVSYQLNHKANYFGKRQGFSIALVGSQQGVTERFEQSQTVGLDVLLNLGQFNFSGEWHWLRRQLGQRWLENQTGFARMGYNIILLKKYVLEPSLMISLMRGRADIGSETGFFSGNDEVIDVGINWYLAEQKLKLNLHYVWQNGDANSLISDGQTFRHGNYSGLGLQFLF